MGVLLFIVILVVLIVGHEFGHLVAAKWARMQVPEFGIGFPPKVWSRVIGDTEYSVNALPFGGFVRIIGENGDHDHPDAFGQKSRWAQAGVLFAGPLMNVVLAFFAFWVAFGVGVPAALDESERLNAENIRVVISEVLADSPAARAGIMPGDTLVGLPSPQALADRIAASPTAIELTVRHDGVERVETLVPIGGLIADEPDRLAIGVGSVLIADMSYGFFESFTRALKATGVGIVNVCVGFYTLIVGAATFSASLEQVSGPVGIAAIVGDATQFGIGHLLTLTAIISLNLAVLNLLPFPALDGGRIVLVVTEVLRGRALKQSIVNAINTLGFVLLITLMLVVTWNDVARLFT